ncbi:hypothetical protein [Fusarium graminearum ormycovirus 1]
MEDSLTDCICMNISDTKITSPQEAKLFVTNQLKKFVNETDAFVISGALERIVVKVLLYSIGKPAPRDGKLAKLVKSVKLADKYKIPLVHLYHENDTPKIVVRIPELAKEDTSSRSSFDSIMTLLHYTTGVKPENMFYHMDSALGTSLVFESVHSKLIDELTASAALPSGAFPGEVIKIGTYQCNLPSILAALHLLSRKSAYLRARSPQGKEKVYTVSSQELRATFNTRTGLSDKSKSYSAMLLKAALAVTVGTTNRIFPGGWIKANRALNQVKSDTGLVYKMGLSEKVPYHHKLMAVLQTDVVEKPDGKLHLVDLKGKEYKEYSFLTFRTGTVLTAPSLNHTSESPMESQMKKDPLSVKNEATLKTFGDTKYHKCINSLNRAHALLLIVGKGNSKTKPIHYQIARNELLHLSSKVPICDGLGGSYSKLSDLPKPTYDFCSKLFRFQGKTKENTQPEEIRDETMTDAPVKKQKLRRSSSVRGRKPSSSGNAPDVPAKGILKKVSAKSFGDNPKDLEEFERANADPNVF